MKPIFFLCFICCLAACNPPRSTQSVHPQPIVLPILKQEQAKQKKDVSQKKDISENVNDGVAIQKSSKKAVPDSYWQWMLEPAQQRQIRSYKVFLKQQQLDNIVPDFELFQSARDWQKCNAQEYEVPPQEIWGNIVPTLHILKRLVDEKIITDFSVTSVYRNFNLNRCAGGADSSRHVFNAALDFRIGSDQPSLDEQLIIQQTKEHLCQFWLEKGQALNMGLGVYASGQIHIDSMGYRTWGPDHRSNSSPCMPASFAMHQQK